MSLPNEQLNLSNKALTDFNIYLEDFPSIQLAIQIIKQFIVTIPGPD